MNITDQDLRNALEHCTDPWGEFTSPIAMEIVRTLVAELQRWRELASTGGKNGVSLEMLEKRAQVGESCGCDAVVPTEALRSLISEVVACRARRAALVLGNIREIDPSAGSPAHQVNLQRSSLAGPDRGASEEADQGPRAEPGRRGNALIDAATDLDEELQQIDDVIAELGGDREKGAAVFMRTQAASLAEAGRQRDEARAGNGLTLDEFQRISVQRRELFYPIPDWALTDWASALAGEAGELCNLLKKRFRGDDISSAEIGKEVANVIGYAVLVAARFGLSSGSIVADRFDEVSRRMGVDVFIGARTPATEEAAPLGTASVSTGCGVGRD